MNHEKHSTTIARVISWRVLATIITVLIAWFITGNVAASISIAGIDMLFKTFGHYLHDRAFINLSRKRFQKKHSSQGVNSQQETCKKIAM